MKCFKVTVAALVCLNSWDAIASPSVRGGSRMMREEKEGTLAEGTFLISEAQCCGDQGTREVDRDETIYIELEDGIYTLLNVESSWAAEAGEGRKIKSGRTKIKVGQGATFSESSIDLHGGTPLVVDDGNEPEDWNGGRSLAALHVGERSVLAVRVVAGDASYGYSEEHLSDKVFGTSGDLVNLASQYSACSRGQLTFSKAQDRAMVINPGDASTNISNGVVTIQVPTTTAQGDGIMVNAITNKLISTFGAYPSTLAHHVMYCLPPGTMNIVAYAYINSWLSVFSDEWCNYPSAQMHEIGHNLNFGHAWDGAMEYGDQSAVMGFSYQLDEGPHMCLNGAKSWQTGWYVTATKEISPTGTLEDSCFHGPLYGVADFELGNSTRTVLVKINDERVGEEDYYVVFNRKKGSNSGTQEGGDKVMITRAANEGEAPISTLVAKLSGGGSHTLSNFGGKSSDVVITVDSIEIAANPGFARVRIEYAGVSCGDVVVSSSPPTSGSPTRGPTSNPTALPSSGPINSPLDACPTLLRKKRCNRDLRCFWVNRKVGCISKK